MSSQPVKYGFTTEFFPGDHGTFCVDGYFCQAEPHPLTYSVLLRGEEQDVTIQRSAIPELSSFSAGWVEANLHVTGKCTKADFRSLLLEIHDAVTGENWSFRLYSYRNGLCNFRRQFSRAGKIAEYVACHGILTALRHTVHTLFAAPSAPPDEEERVPYFYSAVPPEHRRYLNGRVLIIAEMSILQCRYYRVQQKIDMLKCAGIECEAADWTDRCTCMQSLQFASVVIFYRIPYNDDVAKYFREAKKLGLQTGFDIDDLVFDRNEYLKNRNLQALPPADRKNLLNGADYYRTALEHADFTVASTPVLQKYMKKYNQGKSYVIPNALAGEDNGTKGMTFPLGKRCKVVIGYGSGTSTHDYDFEVCAGALLRILRDCPETTLVIHGKLRLPDPFQEFGDRILRVEFIPAAEYWEALQRFDVNLIPLEETVFNDSKSNIKYLEASHCGIPSVASPRAEFVREIRSGENGFLASSEEEWYDALKRLVSSPELRRSMGMKARETVFSKYTLKEIFRNSFAPLLKEQGPAEEQKKRPKVLVVNVLYAPCTFGGATVLTEQMVQEYRRYADPCVFCGYFTSLPHGEGFIKRYSVNDVPVFAYEFPVDGKSETASYSNPSCGRAFSFLLERLKPDLVHFNAVQFLGVEMLHACSKLKIPFIVTAHDAWWICERQFMLDADKRFCGQDKDGIDLYRCIKCTHSKTLFSRWKKLTSALTCAEKVLTPSDYQRDLYVKSGFPAEKIRTNRNGIMLPQDVHPHKLQEVLTFAYLGGKCEHKGYYFLRKIFRKIHGRYQLKLVDVDLKFGSEKISSREWPVPEQTECCAPYDHRSMDEFYSGFDVLLLPSCCKESFGLTAREALVRNIWVIATDAGGDISLDLHDGENGNLCPMFDEDGFAAAVQALIDHPEKLSRFENPYRSEIRSVEDQVTEIRDILNERAK